MRILLNVNLPFGLGRIAPFKLVVVVPSGYPGDAILAAYYARMLGPRPISLTNMSVGVPPTLFTGKVM